MRSFLAIGLTFFSLIAYILVSIDQGNKTRESLKATEQSVGIVKDNFRIENGALLWLKSQPVISYNPDYSQNIRINLHINNFGKTPAINLHYWCNHSFTSKIDTLRFSDDPIILSPHEEIGVSGGIITEINPKYFRIIPTSRSDEFIIKIKNSDSLFFYGMVIYQNFSGIIDTMKFMTIYTNKSLKFNSFGEFNSIRQ